MSKQRKARRERGFARLTSNELAAAAMLDDVDVIDKRMCSYPGCVCPAKDGVAVCQFHHQHHAEVSGERMSEKKRDGKCIIAGCDEKAIEINGEQMVKCMNHLMISRAWYDTQVKRQEEEKANGGPVMCLFMGCENVVAQEDGQIFRLCWNHLSEHGKSFHNARQHQQDQLSAGEAPTCIRQGCQTHVFVRDDGSCFCFCDDHTQKVTPINWSHLMEFKSNGCCEDKCKYHGKIPDDVPLSFFDCDHQPELGVKVDAVSHMMFVNEDKFVKELAKCQCRCKFCHMKRHHPTETASTVHPMAKLIQESKLQKHCSKCDVCCSFSDELDDAGHWKNVIPGAFHFHHRDPKTKSFHISGCWFLVKDITLEMLEIEMSKCDLLCALCHLKEHSL